MVSVLPGEILVSILASYSLQTRLISIESQPTKMVVVVVVVIVVVFVVVGLAVIIFGHRNITLKSSQNRANKS